MKIYYYTRTNRSKNVATFLSQKHQFPIFQITDDENWNGAWNFIKGGKMSSKKEYLPAKYQKCDDNETIILVFPIWANGFPPTVRTFVAENKVENIILIPTSLITRFKERDGYKKVIDLIGKELDPESIDISDVI